ncbi:unnamed protein product [Ilex paraguariensis]|uniref:SHSP domain-containing protein n=1 Tax=Ilex paraguariensis TaxID=185542 RepID=A0ABC8UM55_9AQUA
MASSLLLRRANASPLFNKLTNSICSASVCRSFNTNTQVTEVDDAARGIDIDRRDRSVSSQRDVVVPSIFSDVFDPFFPTRSLSQILRVMDQMMDPFLPASHGLGAAGTRRGWNVKEDKDALYIRIDMPGVDKEKMKITVDQNTLIIRGGGKESEEEEARIYTGRLDLPPGMYKLDEIKAEMKNGVLKITVPKAKEEERKVQDVKVE